MIKNKLALLPHKPGCYLMRDKNNTVIYVGKAKNLKNRVSSYFNGKHTGKTKVLVENIVDFEYIVTNSEVEALVLELNLIKQYNPKYNILLRDDKTYPYIELTNEKYPRLLIVRNHLNKKTKSKLFGPYPNVYAAKKTLNMLNRIYPLRKCSTYNKKACLYFHIGECKGYCVNKIDPVEIDSMINDITRFLKGNDNILIKKIEEKMYQASNSLNFEKAQEMKLLLDDIKTTLNDQHIDLIDYIDRDIFGYYVDKGFIAIQVFYLRGGKLVERESSILPIVDSLEEDLTYFICSFYDEHNIKPKEILISSNLDAELIEDVLGTTVLIPKLGKKKEVLEMAMKNAKIALTEHFEIIKRDEGKTIKANNELSKSLDIKNLHRIDIFDNSHLFGTFSVSGMVVFIDGKPEKSEYRKFKITSSYTDDYHIMKEVIYRRYFRMLKDKLEVPDLIMVDGGQQQVKAAQETINELGLTIPICGLKKNDKHRTNELLFNDKIIDINKETFLFHLLERMQDEVHRFTITYHKDIRSKGALESILDNIAGVGEQRKNQLLKKFTSLDKIKKASLEELQKVLPERVAKELKTYFEKIN